VTNLVAQAAALLIMSIAAVLVTRAGGAAVLGYYTLLRVLPWLVGVIASCGLPFASTYFLGTYPGDRSVRPTLFALLGAGAAVGAGAWFAVVPVLRRWLFEGVPTALLLVVGATVVTQLSTVWAKACCQGGADLVGANLVVVCEELAFLPAYGGALAFGLRPLDAVVFGMVGGGVIAVTIAWSRLLVTGFFADWAHPSPPLARAVVGFGARGQLGNLLWLVNLRLDFIILGALAGSATLGIYAVASKFAELMRLPATALNYVLYPRFTRASPSQAAADARRLLTRACLGTVVLAPVLVLASGVVVPLVFGSAFRPAVGPACILLIGLSVEGAAAVASAYLWGSGRPGANSLGMAVGVVVTVVFDVALIPRHGAVGAAVASTIAYLATTGLLSALTLGLTSRTLHPAVAPATEGQKA
jgi:O-antigen/teichoic acid export membrane protein